MRVDCYNACECRVEEIVVGDTFYYEGDLYIRVAHGGMITRGTANAVCAVMLSTGALCAIADDVQVIKADAKVVANNAV